MSLQKIYIQWDISILYIFIYKWTIYGHMMKVYDAGFTHYNIFLVFFSGEQVFAYFLHFRD